MNNSLASVKVTALSAAVGLCLVAGGCRDREQNPQHVPNTFPATVTPQNADPSSTEDQLPTGGATPTNGMAPTTQSSSAHDSPPILTGIIPPTATPLPYTEAETTSFEPPAPETQTPNDTPQPPPSTGPVDPGTP